MISERSDERMGMGNTAIILVPYVAIAMATVA